MMSPPCRLSLFYDLGVGKKECLPPPPKRGLWNWGWVALDVWKKVGAEGPGCDQLANAGPHPPSPDGVCLQHTRYHTRKPHVTTPAPNTTHDTGTRRLLPGVWSLHQHSCFRSQKTSYFKNCPQGTRVVQGQRLATLSALGKTEKYPCSDLPT